MAKVLELINSGTTELPSEDVELGGGMISIIQSLQINIDLESATSDNIQMTSQSMTDVSDQLQMMSQKMTDVSDQLEMMSQKMPEKHDKNQLMSLKMPEKHETNKIMPQKMRKKHDKIPRTSQKIGETVLAEPSDEIRIPDSFRVTEKTSQKMFEIADKYTKNPNNSNDQEMNEILTKLPMPYR